MFCDGGGRCGGGYCCGGCGGGGGGGRGCGRGGGGDRGCMFEHALAQHPGLYFNEAIALPLGVRISKSIPNAIIFILFIFIYFLLHIDGSKMLSKVWVFR